jgi:hypothetical protein
MHDSHSCAECAEDVERDDGSLTRLRHADLRSLLRGQDVPVESREIKQLAVRVPLGPGVMLIRAAHHRLLQHADPLEELSGRTAVRIDKDEITASRVPEMRRSGDAREPAADDHYVTALREADPAGIKVKV